MRLVILFFLQLSFVLAEEKIEKINLQNIPSNNLLSVVSDSSNFVWIGTDQGLVRYDGIDIDVFRSNPFSSKSLSGNRVWFLDNYNADTNLKMKFGLQLFLMEYTSSQKIKS
jgi:ligand-binding sensor domain-containing protein